VPRWFSRPKTVTHPGANRARRRVTTLIESNTLPLHHAGTLYHDRARYNSEIRQYHSVYLICWCWYITMKGSSCLLGMLKVLLDVLDLRLKTVNMLRLMFLSRRHLSLLSGVVGYSG